MRPRSKVLLENVIVTSNSPLLIHSTLIQEVNLSKRKTLWFIKKYCTFLIVIYVALFNCYAALLVLNVKELSYLIVDSRSTLYYHCILCGLCYFLFLWIYVKFKTFNILHLYFCYFNYTFINLIITKLYNFRMWKKNFLWL